MDNEEMKETQELLEKFRAIREALSAQEIVDVEKEGQDEEERNVEEWVELMHQVGKMDRQKGVEELLVKLKKRERRRRMVFWLRSSSAAAVAIVFAMMAWLGWLKMEIGVDRSEELLNEIKVPTLITLNNNRILSQKTLDLQSAKDGYKVQSAIAKQGIDSMSQRQQLSTITCYQQIVIPAGYTYKVELPDGSQVILNAGSKMTFPEKFTDSLREIEFDGEGFFEVKKSDKPFLVRMDQTQVRVYGTRFNLFHSRELALSEAVLVEGSIGMKAHHQEIKIEPNQCISYSLQDSSFCKVNVNPSNHMAWLSNSFKYEKAKLGRIVFDIAQWYGVQIQVSPHWKERRFSLEFNRSASLEWVINALELMVNQSIKKEGGAYYIE